MFHQLFKFLFGTICNGVHNEVTGQWISLIIELLSQFFPFLLLYSVTKCNEKDVKEKEIKWALFFLFCIFWI